MGFYLFPVLYRSFKGIIDRSDRPQQVQGVSPKAQYRDNCLTKNDY